MSLLNQIKSFRPEAARVFADADLRTDSDIRSLTREDLWELFPGTKQFKLRRAIFDIIHEQKPFDALIRELKAFIPQEHFRAALTGNGVLVEYLHVLKDMKTKMNNVQGFLDAHIGLLDEFSKDQPDQESDRGSLSGMSNSDTSGPEAIRNYQTDDRPQEAQGSLSGMSNSDTSGPEAIRNDQTDDRPQEAQAAGTAGALVPYGHQTGGFTVLPPLDFMEVVYQVVVSGKTFGAHDQLMNQVKNQGQDRVRFVESCENHRVTVLFCPISSRVGSDVDAALNDDKGTLKDKPVILVLMHHTHEPRYTSSMRTWPESRKVVLHVNVFYHDTKNGLLTCDQNNAAVTDVREKLLQYRCWRHQDPSGNGLVVPYESRSGVNGGSTGGNTRDSGGDSNSGGFFNIWSRIGR